MTATSTSVPSFMLPLSKVGLLASMPDATFLNTDVTPSNSSSTSVLLLFPSTNRNVTLPAKSSDSGSVASPVYLMPFSSSGISFVPKNILVFVSSVYSFGTTETETVYVISVKSALFKEMSQSVMRLASSSRVDLISSCMVCTSESITDVLSEVYDICVSSFFILLLSNTAPAISAASSIMVIALKIFFFKFIL